MRGTVSGVRRGVCAVAVAGMAIGLVAACGSSASSGGSATKSPSASAADNAVSVGTAPGADGTYLVGASGRALYLWDADGHNKSVCAGGCAINWPPLTTKVAPAAATGVTMSHLGTITRSGGVKQVTYDVHPLDYFAGDTSKGSVTGQGSNDFGAKWWLVAPSGAAITKSAGSPTPSGY